MNTESRLKNPCMCTRLKLWFVCGRIGVLRPEAFKFFFRSDLTVISVECMNCLITMQLQKEPALKVNMICGNSSRSRYKNIRIAHFHIIEDVVSTQRFDLI